MNRHRKFLKLGLSAACLCAMTSSVMAEDVIKIGLPVPLTGDFAAYNEVDGARCMTEMINRDGGVDGKKIELLIQDTGSDTQTAISLTEKFLGEGVVSIGTIPFSDTMIPVAQIAAANGVSIIQSQSTQVEMHSGVLIISSPMWPPIPIPQQLRPIMRWHRE